MSVERGTLSKPELKDFGAKVVLFCHITTRIPGEPHDELLKEKGGRGFPTFWFLDPTGKVIGEPKGRSVADFEATLKEVLPKMPPFKGPKRPKIWKLEDALKEGKDKELVVLLLIKGDKDKNDELTKSLYDKKHEKTLAKFLFVEHTFDKEDELCKKLDVKDGPVLLAIDPHKEKIEEAVLGTFKDDKPSVTKMGDFLKKWEKAAEKKK